MARDKALWAAIRADFLASGTAYPDLAKKYGVSLSTLKKTAAREAWALNRADIDDRAKRNRKKEPEPDRNRNQEEPEPAEALIVPTDEEIVEAKQQRLDKFLEITDAMMDRISDAIESPDVITPYALKLLASALRDLREMQGLNRTQLDIEEQRARIAKIRSETAIPESRDDKAVSIEFVDTYGAET